MLTVAEYASFSDVGRRRSANEDAYLARPPLFAVADGMGGAQAGEVASKLAIEELQQMVFTAEGDLQERLATQVAGANKKIYQLAVNDSAHAGMGTTLTMAFVDVEQLVVAHVGDSRLYQLRDGTLKQVTNDHSLVQELIRQGKITEEEARVHPQRSVITKALGPEAAVEPDIFTVEAHDDDLYLLCSDGLTGMIDENRIHELATAEQNLPRLAKLLVEAANAAGGSDNITVVLFRLAEKRLASQEQTRALREQPTEVHRLQEQPATKAVAKQRQTEPLKQQETPMSRRKRYVGSFTIAAILFSLAMMGAYTATQAVFFIGVDRDGFVTVFQGVPYDLPGGISPYRPLYHSGVLAATLPDQRRRKLFDHQLRSRDDAGDLVRKLERGEIE